MAGWLAPVVAECPVASEADFGVRSDGGGAAAADVPCRVVPTPRSITRRCSVRSKGDTGCDCGDIVVVIHKNAFMPLQARNLEPSHQHVKF